MKKVQAQKRLIEISFCINRKRFSVYLIVDYPEIIERNNYEETNLFMSNWQFL
jgi:hypothetical protein